VEPTDPPERGIAADGTFTRHVRAVLLADVTGFSALMAEDDEGTARAVRDLQRLVLEIVAEAKGHADAFAGDAIFAVFDSVVAAVDAALMIQRRIGAREFAGRRLQVRMGVHYGDVLLRPGGPLSSVVGDAINIAARLQTLAKPGTICISDGVYRQVRNKFDERFVDLGNHQLKNISEPVHAYLLVPREVEAVRVPRRSFIAWSSAAALCLMAGLGIAALLRYQRAHEVRAPEPPRGFAGLAGVVTPAEAPEETGRVALGVMLFKNLGGNGEADWRREALRDGLNTQLSQLSHVKVYSKEFIDFLMTRKGLTDIEAASQLGIKKMLSGSFVAMNGTLRIETHVVDVTTGVLEASYTTTGPEQDFLDLQNKTAFGVIAQLNLPVTEEEKQVLLAQQATTVDALKLLLEAESPTAAKPDAPAPRVPQSRLESRRALCWLGAAPARADDAGAAQAAIHDVLERYRRAIESKEIQALAAVYTDFSPEQQAAQRRYFDNVSDLKVTLADLDIAVVGDEAVVSYTRTDNFLDARTGRPMHVAVRLTKMLRRVDGTWKLASGK
jgi:adenylate cyclase